MKGRKAPRRSVDPRPAPRGNIGPAPIAIGGPTGSDVSGRIPDVAVIGITRPATIGVQFLIAGHVRRNVTRRLTAAIRIVALLRPDIERTTTRRTPPEPAIFSRQGLTALHHRRTAANHRCIHQTGQHRNTGAAICDINTDAARLQHRVTGARRHHFTGFITFYLAHPQTDAATRHSGLEIRIVKDMDIKLCLRVERHSRAAKTDFGPTIRPGVQRIARSHRRIELRWQPRLCALRIELHVAGKIGHPPDPVRHLRQSNAGQH